MPVRYHVHDTEEFLSIRIHDPVEAHDLAGLGERLLNDPDFRAHWPQLVDLRGLSVSPEPAAVKTLAHYLMNSYRPGVRNAIAVVMDGHADGELFAGVYLMVCNLPATEVFDDYGHAIKWLLGNERTARHAAPANASQQLKRLAR